MQNTKFADKDWCGVLGGALHCEDKVVTYSVFRYSVVQCSVIHYSVVHCILVHYSACSSLPCGTFLQCCAVQ